MKAIAYLRVSTDEQAEEGISLEAQASTIDSYCRMRGFDLVDVVEDRAVSGSIPLAERKNGRRVLELVANGQAGAVVALKLDRLFRDCVDCLTVVGRWDQTGVALHLVDLGGQAVDTSSAMGRFFLTVMAGAAEMERNLIRERTRLALAEKRRQGEHVGSVPFGFDLDGPGGRLIPNPEETAVIERICELRGQKLSLRSIAAVLNAAGVPTKRGSQWSGAHVLRVLDRVEKQDG